MKQNKKIIYEPWEVERELPVEARASYRWVQRSIENDGSCG